ncbi:MAG: helix-turn-helix transcriptional regulator [Lachnospiraceae bacterium]|nr:helix-turn-helix transcriptional regulator [Lachnospiraceae bacterium]
MDDILALVTLSDKKEVPWLVPYGKRLVNLRGRRSQAVVAKSVGIATSTLGMYETEQRVPRDSVKVALANFYGTTVQEIFFDEECHEKGHLKEGDISIE